MAGLAFAFVRRSGAFGLGHVGWGYTYSADYEWGNWEGQAAIAGKPPYSGFFGRCGSTENGSGWPIRWKHIDDFWTEQVLDRDSMGVQMDHPPPFGGKYMPYGEYKVMRVESPNVTAAEAMVLRVSQSDYVLGPSDCLNHARDVLTAYGVNSLPWATTNPIPNGWFDAVDGIDTFYG